MGKNFMDKNCMRARLGGEIGKISGYNFLSVTCMYNIQECLIMWLFCFLSTNATMPGDLKECYNICAYKTCVSVNVATCGTWGEFLRDILTYHPALVLKDMDISTLAGLPVQAMGGFPWIFIHIVYVCTTCTCMNVLTFLPCHAEHVPS